MELQWTSAALRDLTRLHAFLKDVDAHAAAQVIKALTAAPTRLRQQPRMGEKLDQFNPREVRRILAGTYEMRYEVRESAIIILRIWHTREQR